MTFSLSPKHDSLEDYLADRAPNQPEFHQAVVEVMGDIKPIIDQHAAFKDANVFARLAEPERMISFQVPWQTDEGTIEVNRGYRVQYNGAIGPYKGGLRFHPSVNPSILKFLGFEQTFKNALTGLPMGGGKGGSDFNPKGRSEAEIMRFCSAFMQELHRHIGPDIDVPAGDINVGGREIGYLFGAYRRITNRFQGVLTGKGQSFGGSAMRTQATGFGVIYFLNQMLEAHDDGVEGKRVIISGAGNVATYAAQKAVELGARVITLSDSNGTIHDPDGLSQDKIDWVRSHKAQSGASLEAYVDAFGGTWHSGDTPWGVEADIALPCATQNELDGSAAKTLLKNGTMAVVEGANMPCTADAKQALRSADILYAPGKAANAGGVAVSGLEISQNRTRRPETADEVDEALHQIMFDIHSVCVEEGTRDGAVDYTKGANIAGFRKVADAIVMQGVG
ncbi:NADP-specific glutamate dehydrogenase [Sulfitobacter sp. S190]|uniref:NADP-specific glutamate dehydrogenase n=1 Tax=Sulfitobacter sp. S190 TaxID=2867022 RepID=UPI0021A30677|nr:NADP-specific glutamate dehydrogenase [Sulfitobacter sp. S190]UWR24456.1 NADP-specific glutamate dehydrogenase [Sulfitobacter sp. S190]